MAPRTQIRRVTVDHFSTKSREEIVAENIKNEKIRQLTTLRIYHQEKIKGIERELDMLLKEDVGNIDY